MKNSKNFLKIILGFLIFLAYFIGVSVGERQADFSEIEIVELREVIDGDTIRVENIESNEVFKVRYLGIDTPEMEGESYETCFEEEAKEKNEELVSGKKLLLEYDRDRYDQFGRNLAYVYTLNEEGEKETFVNLNLLEEGYARFYLDKQNTLFQEEFIEASNEAHENFLGLWGVCGEEQYDRKCVIKGNVDERGKKFYHLPGDKYYSHVVIRLSKENQWLCTIEEAESKNFQWALH